MMVISPKYHITLPKYHTKLVKHITLHTHYPLVINHGRGTSARFSGGNFQGISAMIVGTAIPKKMEPGFQEVIDDISRRSTFWNYLLWGLPGNPKSIWLCLKPYSPKSSGSSSSSHDNCNVWEGIPHFQTNPAVNVSITILVSPILYIASWFS